eukprot:CAMPEP_0201617514 /NCGR_PEP_ID=MMETSP0492-20130828/36556_1 /ASSEMBLY_ACC=CAM_ASM_000837 /TAXON_ID=420259 /ORGANISM="Thalassiosira gravida, Strain GMp14c1" /LENGTH=52 /DNA_ID=CAMNT_0048085799 /DNA_START=461 /DNA_END=616 /DNA_ORIENTATION=-
MGALALVEKLTPFFGCDGSGGALEEELFSFSVLFMAVVGGVVLSTMDADLTG